MKLKALFEEVNSNQYFVVQRSMQVQANKGFAETDEIAVTTRSDRKMHKGTYQPMTLKRGDQIHALLGGMFAVKGDADHAVPIKLSKGKDESAQEKLDSLQEKGAISSIPRASRKKVKYKS